MNRHLRAADIFYWVPFWNNFLRVMFPSNDLHLLARAAGVAKAKKRDTLDEVLAAPDRDELIGWLRRRPLVHVADGFLMVHAGVHMAWSLAEVEGFAREFAAALRGPGWATWVASTLGKAPSWRPHRTGDERVRAILGYLVRARMCTADGDALHDFDGAPAEAPPGALPWYALAPRALREHVAVFGHWAAHGTRVTERIIATDSACVWGGALTAVRLDDRAVFAVPAVEPPAG